MGIRQLALAVTVVCLVVGSHRQQATAAIVNGGFEAGDLTGWTFVDRSARVATTALKLGEGGEWSPAEGDYFAILETGNELAGVYRLLSQSFSVLAGQTLSLYAFFDAGDYLPFNDDGYVKLIDTGTGIPTTLYAKSVLDVGNAGSHGWQHLTYTFSSSGNYQIEAGVRNVEDSDVASWIGLDGVSLSDVLEPVSAPEPATLAIWGTLGALGLIATRRKRVA